ncbi:hypothetical protein DSO57_1038111 [Entomophthora muscae]|uniref:Uncharacterized protein n=1 Tax=Entomophthora muscae TaxID=34485 RepID=A0ACC2SZM6_9FUNG|nr:hypothetical protein DSO57_1038111 [Entomophthora muscae]
MQILLQSPASTASTVPASVSGLVSSSAVPAASFSVLSAPTQNKANSEDLLNMQKHNTTKTKPPTDVMIENITTKEIENNHHSADHNNFPNHATATPQCNSLRVIKATQLTSSNPTIMKMRPDATIIVPRQVHSQDSLS